MKITVKQMVSTAILLAICIVFQYFKHVSVYITGPAVNAVLVIAVLSNGLWSGMCIAIISPLIAWMIGATPIVQMIPLMMPVIMAGNAMLAVAAALFKKKNLILGLGIGSVCKTAWLWLMVWYLMLPVFGTNVPEAAKTAMKTTFSITQLITALTGAAIAFIVWKRIEKTIERTNA